MTPESIASRRFEIVKKGFATEEVTAFLAKLSDHVRALEGRLEAVGAETDALRRAVETAYTAEVITPVVVQEVPAAGGTFQGEAGPEAEAVSAEALRVVTAAEETAQEILASAEEAAARIRSEAQMDAEKAKGQADEYADRAARRLAIQSQEVRDKLREEVRRVRAEVADEAERLLSRAREEAGRIEGEAVRTDDGTVVSRLVADAEAETDVARQAAEILSAAREKADEIVDHARRSRREIVARLNDERVRLDEHVRLLQTVQKRLQADITAARNAFAGVLGNLDGLNLHDTELPVLDAELVAMVELDLDAVGDTTSPAADDTDGPRGTHLGEIEGNDLFDRVVAERGSAGAVDGTPRARPDAGGSDAVTDAVEEGTESAEQSLPAELDETTWGDDDLSNLGGESGGLVATAGDGVPADKPDPRSRLKAAFSTLTAELEAVGGEEAPGEATAAEEPVALPGDAPSAESLTADPMAGLREAAVTKFQPAVARKLKRAIQQAENIALHAHKTGATIEEEELTAELVEHVSGVVRDVAATATEDACAHAGREAPEAEAESDVDASAVREIIDSVAGDWWASLVQDLVATDESGVHGVVRSRRQQAGRVAVDLTREAYDAGLLRAAITWAD